MSLPRIFGGSKKGKHPFEVIDKKTGERFDPNGMEVVLFQDGNVGTAYPMDCFAFDDQHNYEVRFLESDYDEEAEKRKAEKREWIDKILETNPWLAKYVIYPEDED